MKRPQIAIIDSHPVQYRAPLYRRIQERGRVDATVLFKCRHGIGPSYSPDLQKEVQYDVDLLSGYEHQFLPNWSVGNRLDPPFGQIAPTLVKKLRPSAFDGVVFLGYTFLADWIGFATAASFNLPYLLRNEATLIFDRPGWRRLLRDLAVGTLVGGATGALPIGKKNAEFYRYYKSQLPLFCAPYSVDNNFFREQRVTDPGRLERIAESFGLRLNHPVVVFCGKLINRKRPADLINAVDRLSDEHVQALIVGSGPLLRELKAKVRVLGLQNRVRFAGFLNQSELGKAYSLADVFVLPSEEETWGLVVNEAMNFGAPVVTTDRCGCAYDLVEEGETGFVVPVGDVEMLSERIKDVLAMIERKGDEVEAAVLTKVSQYSLDRTAEGFEEAAEFVAGLG